MTNHIVNKDKLLSDLAEGVMILSLRSSLAHILVTLYVKEQKYDFPLPYFLDVLANLMA